jgi:hypothetical protein
MLVIAAAKEPTKQNSGELKTIARIACLLSFFVGDGVLNKYA